LSFFAEISQVKRYFLYKLVLSIVYIWIDCITFTNTKLSGIFYYALCRIAEKLLTLRKLYDII